jgi:hypothetical protein
MRCRSNNLPAHSYWRLRRFVPQGSNIYRVMSAFPSGPLQLTALIVDSSTFLSPRIEWVPGALRQAK